MSVNTSLSIDLTEVDLSLVEVAEAVAAKMFSPNATFSKGPKAEEIADLPIVQEVAFGILSKDAILIKGKPGTGKTSFAVAFANALAEALPELLEEFKGKTVKTVYWNMPNNSPEDAVYPLPVLATNDDGTEERRLGFMLAQAIMQAADDPNVHIIIVMDEPSRASVQVQNQMLELVQSRTLGDQPIPNLLTVIACDNVSPEDGIYKGADLAMADRWHTVVVDSNQTPWRYALANKFANYDLSGVFDVYRKLTAAQRNLLAPRTLEHVLWNLIHGLPGIIGLPLVGGTRARIVDENGNDRTSEIMGDIARALGTANREKFGDYGDLIRAAVNERVNLFVQGAPGIGKTAYTRAKLIEEGVHPDDILALSMPVTSPENLALPIPADGKLDIMLLDWLRQPAAGPKGKVLICDEIWRAPMPTRQKVMEILQERSIAGKSIPDLACVIGLNNPKEVAGFKLDVGKPDRAQADRFHMSVELTATDVPWAAHLLKVYGDHAELFIEWWKESLDDRGRVLISARCLERMIHRYLYGLDVDNAKPFMDGEHVPVSTHELKAMLANRPITKFKSIVNKVDYYEAKLGAENGHQDPDQWSVFAALNTAEVVQLEAHRDVCLRMIGVLNRQNKLNLVRTNKSRQTFWSAVLRESEANKKAKQAKR